MMQLNIWLVNHLLDFGEILNISAILLTNIERFNTNDCVHYKNRENYFNEIIHPLIKYVVELLAKQLQNDIRILCFDEHDNKDISNAAKWVPQEKSKSFGWIYKMLAITYKKIFIQTLLLMFLF